VPADLPVVAIGGIAPDRASAVIDAGASAVVVIGGLLAGGHPIAAVRQYRQALGEA
jgi:thiamine monophosphate synthase